MTGSKSLGSTYTNATGKPIMVIITSAGVAVGVITYYYLNGGVAGYTRAASNSTYTVSFIVPTGNTYAVSAASTVLINWLELR